MKISFIKLICMVFVMSFLVLFPFNEKVDAAYEDADGQGYAQCYYDWNHNYPYGAVTITRPFRLGINFYRDKAKNFKISAEFGCGGITPSEITMVHGMNYVAGPTKKGVCEIVNIDKKEYFSNGYKNEYNSKKGWTCPNLRVYYSKAYSGDDENDKMILIYDKGNDEANKKERKDVLDKIAKIGTENYYLNGFNYSILLKPKLDESKIADSGTPTELNVENHATHGDVLPGDPKGIRDWAKGFHINNGTENTASCEIIAGETSSEIQKWVNIMKIIGIILLLLSTFKELVKSVVSSEENVISKNLKIFAIRAGCLVALLLLPVLVDWIIKLINISSDPLCNIK